MRTKTTLFLLVLLAALGVVAFYVLQTPSLRIAERGVILPPEEAAVLDYLRIEFADRPAPIVLEKQNAGWHITEPVLWPANVFAVERLLSQLQLLKKVSSFPAERLAEYGLEPADGVLTYGFGVTRRQLRIGHLTDMAPNVYLLPDGSDTIVVAKREVRDDLRRPLEELRSDTIFSVPLFEVRNWIVQIAEAGNLRVHIVREGERWKLESLIRARADKAAVDTLLKHVLDLRVDAFQRDGTPDLNALGLVRPTFRITIHGSGGRDELLLGAQVDAATTPELYYAKREDNDTVFTVRVDSIPELRNAQVALRDRRVIEFDSERLQSIMLTPAGQPPVTLQRLETGAWQVLSRTPDRGLVTMDGDPAVIGNLVQEIASLRAVRDDGFVSDSPLATDLDRTYGLTGASWQIQIAERAPAVGGQSQPRVQTITLGRRPEDKNKGQLQYARADEGFVYLVDRGLADDLHPEPYYYRNRQLLQMAAGERITSLTLKRLATDETVFFAQRVAADQTWADALITQPPERRAGALAAITELRNLRAGSIVSPEFNKSVPGGPELRPWTWWLEATIALEGGTTQQNTKLRLFIDSFTGGTELLVGVPDLNLVYSAPVALIDALRPLVFERDDPGLPPAPAEEPPPPAAAPPAP